MAIGGCFELMVATHLHLLDKLKEILHHLYAMTPTLGPLFGKIRAQSPVSEDCESEVIQ